MNKNFILVIVVVAILAVSYYIYKKMYKNEECKTCAGNKEIDSKTVTNTNTGVVPPDIISDIKNAIEKPVTNQESKFFVLETNRVLK